MFYILYYFFVGSRTSWLLLCINNFMLWSSITSKDRSNSYSRIGVIFSKGFERNPVTLSFLTSVELLLVILTSSINILVLACNVFINWYLSEIYLRINTISKLKYNNLITKSVLSFVLNHVLNCILNHVSIYVSICIFIYVSTPCFNLCFNN